jgi:5,10-methylenetetrahydromethanopterin reductase
VRIGLYISSVGGRSLDEMIAGFVRAETRGFDTAWAGHTLDWDAMSLLSLAGRATHRIELGSWVVPTYPRHPVALAQQALTTQSACSDRLLLGLGVSHAAVIEKRMGLDYSTPLRHMSEVVQLLPRLMAGEPTRFEGDVFRISAQLDPLGASPPRLVVAALGPRMLELAGGAADGVAIWLGGAKFLKDFALARIDEGAQAAGRRRPRVIVGLPVSVTRDPGAREAAEAFLGPSSRLPAYRAVLEREGRSSAGSAALIGDEAFVRESLQELASIGVTDFNAIPFSIPGDRDALERTEETLSGIARQDG